MEYLYWSFVILLLPGSSSSLRTGVHEKTYTDGPEGKCELFTPRNHAGEALAQSAIRCRNGWTKNVTSEESDRLAHKPECKYSKRVIYEHCYNTSEGTRVLTCIKRIVSYYITTACRSQWLNWEECDKKCGGGVAKHVKLTSCGYRYIRETESRTCNTHQCPAWSAWSPIVRGGSGEECDKETCTSLWQRACMYNGTVTDAELCDVEQEIVDGVTGDARTVLGYSVINSTHEIRPCALSKCVEPPKDDYIPVRNMTEADRTTNPTRSSLPTATATSDDNDTTHSGLTDSNSISATSPVTASNAWMAIGISAIVALVIFSFACFVLGRKRSLSRIFMRPFKRRFSSGRRDSLVSYIGGMRTNSRGIAGNEEYLQPDIIRQMLGTPPAPPLRRTTLVPTASLRGVEMAPTASAMQVFSHTAQPLVTEDPIYSHITPNRTEAPAVRPSRSSSPEGHFADYSSSEFDSTGQSSDRIDAKQSASSDCPEESQETDDASAALTSTVNNPEDGCKSFDSDEGRDVVNTLRKTSRRMRSKRLSEREFLPEADENLSEEDAEIDHMSERRSAYDARYSKLQAKRARDREQQQRASIHLGDFQRSEMDVHPFQRTPRLNNQVPIRRHSSSYTRLPLRRISSGNSSICSFMFDATTSGYNSAFGDSSDGDGAFYDGYSINHQHHLSKRDSPFGRDIFNSSRRSIDCRLPMELPTHHGPDFRQRMRQRSPSSSLCNSRTSLPDAPRPRWSSVRLERAQRYGGMLPRSAHDVSLHARSHTENRHARKTDIRPQSIEIEDKYKNPIDAMRETVQDAAYSTYSVPFNSISGDRVA